ncbi:MAG: hypothetical protein AAFX56_01800 [Pseudomonadota bacterium]
MQASQPLIQQSPRDTVLDMAAEMLKLAERGDWEQLESVTVMLRSAIVKVPEGERLKTAQAVQATTEQVRELAERSRGDVMSRLKAIRRGQSAARAYGVATGHHQMLPAHRPEA